MIRTASITEIENTRFKTWEFEGRWKACFGLPQPVGSWIIWGESFNGKSNFVIQLAKYLSQFARVLYYSLEEGISESLKKSIERHKLRECGRRIQFPREKDLETIKQRLRSPRSPEVVIIDSFQYTGLTYKQYVDLKDEFPAKLFIWVSHADGIKPEGNAAKKVKYDAFVKIRVEGYVATIMSRFKAGPSENFVIWQEGADKYWGKIQQQ